MKKNIDDDVSCLDCDYCYIDDLFYEECCKLPHHECKRATIWDKDGLYDGHTTIPCKDFKPQYE